MKKLFLLINLIIISSSLFAQEEIFTSRKGSKFFPRHLDIVLTINNENVQYELFNHWYSGSYSELRKISIKINEIEKFNSTNDSIKMAINKNSISLIDKKHKINKKVKKRKLCMSIENMRKISYAYKISNENKIGHFSLYNYEDLKLTETEFYRKVDFNLTLIKEEK